MKARRDFFKDEAAFLEYMLLYGSQERTDILGITVKHYSDKALANRWALGIASKITDEDALEEVKRIYRRMVEDEEAELPTADQVAEAGTIDTFKFATENGLEALKARLEQMTMEELKQTIKENDLDPARQYGRAKKAEKLIDVILAVTDQRLRKGYGFI